MEGSTWGSFIRILRSITIFFMLLKSKYKVRRAMVVTGTTGWQSHLFSNLDLSSYAVKIRNLGISLPDVPQNHPPPPRSSASHFTTQKLSLNNGVNTNQKWRPTELLELDRFCTQWYLLSWAMSIVFLRSMLEGGRRIAGDHDVFLR